MTPKEKAKDLFDKFKIGDVVTEKLQIVNIDIYSKLFALRAVDEILNTLKIFPEKDTTSKSVVNFSVSRIMYWVQVKKELEKLQNI
jgi:hypothetical protein